MNLSINVLQRTRRPGALPEHATDRSLRSDDRPDARCAQDERLRRVRAALDRLDEAKRTILVLRAYEGLSYDAIAERGRTGLSGETYFFDDQGVMISRSRFEQQLVDLARTSLPRRSVLWWHYAEHASLPSAAVRPETIDFLAAAGHQILRLVRGVAGAQQASVPHCRQGARRANCPAGWARRPPVA